LFAVSNGGAVPIVRRRWRPSSGSGIVLLRERRRRSRCQGLGNLDGCPLGISRTMWRRWSPRCRTCVRCWEKWSSRGSTGSRPG